MKLFLTGLVLIGSMVGFNSNSNTNHAVPKQKMEKSTNASDVVNSLKQAGLPIGSQLVYTMGNDPDKLMGRAGQYASKVNFADTTTNEAFNVVVLTGGSVEMFNNHNDAKNRFDYLSQVAKSSPMYDEYDYVQGKILLRLTKNLPLNYVKKYEEALKQVKQ